MKYILFIFFIFQTIFAGREFIACSPLEKLHEFILRRHQIITHINCVIHSEQDEYWNKKFDQLCDEVEKHEVFFKQYFNVNNNATTTVQKRLYNGFIKELAKDKATNETANVVGEAIAEHLLRLPTLPWQNI